MSFVYQIIVTSPKIMSINYNTLLHVLEEFLLPIVFCVMHPVIYVINLGKYKNEKEKNGY